MNARAINLNPTWTYVNAVLKPDEKSRCHTVVGTILRPSWGIGELAKATKADVRDVLVFTNERLLAVSPHPTRAIATASGRHGATMLDEASDPADDLEQRLERYFRGEGGRW